MICSPMGRPRADRPQGRLKPGIPARFAEMVKISDNADTDEDEPEALFDGVHHAREPGTYTAMLYAMWYMLENYGTDAEATYLINNRELYFVPVVNVDGFLHNQQNSPSGGGMWRLNRRDNGDGSIGIYFMQDLGVRVRDRYVGGIITQACQVLTVHVDAQPGTFQRPRLSIRSKRYIFSGDVCL